MDSTISKEAIGELPLCQFEGTITVVEDPQKVDEIVEELLSEKVIGFDTETKPSFKKGALNEISLLQLSTSDKAYLFRLNKTGFNGSLVKLFENSAIIKVGVGIRDDLRGLKRLANFKPSRFVEIQEMVKSFGIDVFSLKALAGLILSVRISKRQRLSNWESDSLTPAQIDYAATDAWIAYRIFEELMLIEPTYKVKSLHFKN
ncbi:3'-5' exonuclease [Natronoflexus pectinivorans]|uniref:3'-5' exonuclease n=1 Tax=Natronoflexus pectinivorans TaxID=682526 RepID=A0A4R2GC11_9BACT|nr:3'-5' exonuclease [Natronoflexus pectinivorans]TCO05380.1 3'-5' exonuclease [Natronoflexus pectinivorans]